jgi:glycosyltransferase involved in cell wall biosynthesis
MKILALTHTYPRFENDTNAPFVQDLCEAHAAAGHETTVLTAFDKCIDPVRLDKKVDLKTYRYIWPDSMHLLGYSRTIEADVRLKKSAALLGPLMLGSATAKLLRIVREMKPDVIHAHWIVPNGFSGALVSKITGVPLFCSLWGSDIFVAEKNRLYAFMAAFAGRQSSVVTSCSAELKDRLVALGVSENKVELVSNGCYADQFRPNLAAGAQIRREFGIAPGEIMVLALGRFAYKKGFDHLIRAAKHFAGDGSDVRLVIAGSGDLEGDLKAQARSTGLGDRILFPGLVARDRVPSFFAACDIFAMPSVHDPVGNVDGLPTVIVEAMGAEKAIVASDISGIPLAIRHEETGLLVPPADENTLTETIQRLIDDKDLRSKLGRAARQLVVEELDWSHIAARHRQIYLNAMKTAT